MCNLATANQVSAAIAFINIAATILLTIINLLFGLHLSKRGEKREALVNYYLPIKYKLQETMNNVNLMQLSTTSLSTGMHIFMPNYPRKGDILRIYTEYLAFYEGLKKYSAFINLDKELFAIYCHYSCLKFQNNSHDCEKLNEHYPAPDINNTIKLIENCYKKYR